MEPASVFQQAHCTKPSLHLPLQSERNFDLDAENNAMQVPFQENSEHSGAREAPLRVCLLGAFSLQVQGEETPTLPRPARWLFALLILRRQAALSREWLAETLWPEATQERSAFYLRRSLTELRNALGSERYRLLSPTRATLTFDFADAFCDVIAYDRLVEAEDAASLEKAVALYQGVLLEGCDAEWALLERVRRMEQFIVALERLARHQERARNLVGATRFLRRVVEADPLRETAHRKLMQALGQAGDYIGLERQYRELRRALRDELNMEPAQETVTLYQKWMQEARQPVAPSAQAPRAAVRDTPYYDNVPRPLAELIGRVREQEEITVSLRANRLVTLTGTGGVGKTRLAMAAAAEQRKAFAQGVVWIELVALRSGEQVAQAISVALRLSERIGETALQTVTDYLRPKRLLLVLNNCEHLLENCAELVRTLLESCAALHILTTSRQALGLFGESVWNVPSLATPQMEFQNATQPNLLQRVRESDAARLFLTRAHAVSGDFQLTETNAGSIAQICWKLEGIPLALELAAVWVRSLSVGQIAQRLDNSLTLLERGDRTADPRHQTLRSLLDWSYSLLDVQERILLSRLALFAGGWTLEAASAICFENDKKENQALALLESLIQKSLVEVGERNGEARYRLLEPIRQYALERLVESEEEQTHRQQHLGYFQELVERLTQQLESPKIVEALARIEADYNNFRAALRYSLDASCDETRGEHALRIAIALSRFQAIRGYYQEGLTGLEEAMKRYTAPDDAPLRGEAMLNAGLIGLRLGDIHLSRSYGDATEAFYRPLPVSTGLVKSLRIRAIAATWGGHFPQAKALYEEGMALARQIGDRDSEARLQIGLGNLLRGRGETTRPLELHTDAARHFQAASLFVDEAVAQHNLGVTTKVVVSKTAAKPHFLRSLELHRKLESRSWMGTNLFELGNVALSEGNLTDARTFGEEALTLCRVGDRNFVPLCLELLAGVEWQLENFAGVRDYLVEALSLKLQMEVQHNMVDTMTFMCSLLREERRYILGAQLLAAIVASHGRKNIWLISTNYTHIEELWANFRDMLGEEVLAEIQRKTDETLLDELLAAALK